MDSQTKCNIVLHRGPASPRRYVWSPFVTKLELRLRFSSIPYDCGSGGPLAGPKGKIPYIELSVPGTPLEQLADTSLIIKALIRQGLLQDMNDGLSAKATAHDLAIRALLEDKLFFYNTHERWIQNYYTMRDYTMGKLPYPQRICFGYLAYRRIVRKLHDQGTGRFADEEIRSFRQELWEGVNGLLEESRRNATGNCFWVLGGQEPTEADATMYGFTVSAIVADAGPESRDLVKAEFPAVVDYATRIHHRFFPDYEIWD